MVCNALIRYYIAPSRDGDGILDAYQQAFHNNPRLSPFIDFLSSQANQTNQTSQTSQTNQTNQHSPTTQPSITPQKEQCLQQQPLQKQQPPQKQQPSITPQKQQTLQRQQQPLQRQQPPHLLYPVLPGSFCSCALCSPLASLSAAVTLTQQTPYLAESKFDGVRIQLHRTDDGVRLFGRSGEVGPSLHPHA